MDAQTSGFVINFWSLWKGICIVAMAETIIFFFLIRMAETIKLEGGYMEVLMRRDSLNSRQS